MLHDASKISRQRARNTNLAGFCASFPILVLIFRNYERQTNIFWM